MDKEVRKLLVIDNNAAFLNNVEPRLRDRYTVVKSASGKRALELLQAEAVFAVLLDLQIPDMDGFEVLKRIHEKIDPHLPVIIVSGHQDVETAVQAIRLGAYDFIPNNCNSSLLSARILKALGHRSLEMGAAASKRAQVEGYNRMVFVGEEMKKIHYRISHLANVGFDLLLMGETGVGKDLIAFELHRRGPRKNRPFMSVPIKSLSESLIESELFGHEKGAFSGAERGRVGKLEAANGGTVYLPEVSSISEAVQLKLLQFMQYKTLSKVGQDARAPERKLDVRMIFATNENLEELVAKGIMRTDFYHRISGVRLQIPPLRERTDDIEPLARYFMTKFSAELGGKEYLLAPEVLNAFRNYAWPGNVRELENVMKSALAYSEGGRLTLEDFPNLSASNGDKDQAQSSMTLRSPSLGGYREEERRFKRAYFQEVLRRAGNNVPKAASFAGLTPQGLRKILNTLQIRKE